MYYAKDLQKGDCFKLPWWKTIIQVMHISTVHVMVGIEPEYYEYLLFTDLKRHNFAIHPDAEVIKMQRLSTL